MSHDYENADKHSPYTTAFVDGLVRETVKETLRELGINAAEPFETQKDIAFLRRLRNASDSIVTKILSVGILAILSGAIGLTLIGLRDWLSR